MPSNFPQKLATPHAHGRRKGLGRPAVHKAEHALAEVFHGAKTNVGCSTVYGAEDEEA